MIVTPDVLDVDIKLPSAPGVAVRILEAVREKWAGSEKLARVISADPALAARILKVANSSLYALPQKINSIQKAVTVIGTNLVKNIALSFVIVQEMRGRAEGGFDFDFFWKRSLTAAVAADLLATRVSGRSDDVFVTALLQDIGIAVMFLSRSRDYLLVLDEKMVNNRPIEDAEREIFGFDHQQMGARVLAEWGLPENMHVPIAYHHMPEKVPEIYRRRTGMLRLSDRLASIYHGTRCVEKIQDIKKKLSGAYGMTESQAAKLVDAVAERSIEMLNYFEIPPADMKPFSQILQEANEELGKLNFSYELLVMELKQARDQSDDLARRLKEANAKLREMAARDSLTGLYNHGYFQDAMERELQRCVRYRRPLSLVMADLDRFKSVNDRHGHQVGDRMLRKVGATFLGNVRNSDIAARYGGEEFAVILPETDIRGAGVLAERIRRAVEKIEVEDHGVTVRLTLSAGVSSYYPGSDSGNKAGIISAADKALYLSKQSGRNRITLVK